MKKLAKALVVFSLLGTNINVESDDAGLFTSDKESKYKKDPRPVLVGTDESGLVITDDGEPAVSMRY